MPPIGRSMRVVPGRRSLSGLGYLGAQSRAERPPAFRESSPEVLRRGGQWPTSPALRGNTHIYPCDNGIKSSIV
jgi:hypothetical protein